MTTFPKKITFHSDDTVLEFIEEKNDKALKERFGKYIYKKAKVLFGTTIFFSLTQLDKLLKDKMIEIE